MAGIYIHIPFCTARCTYCDFTSYPNRINQADAYMACVYKEIKLRGYELKDKLFNTVYIGGGTPSSIDAAYIAGLIKCVKRELNLISGAEITIELNPDTADKDKLDVYKKAGVNRFSIGMQSANDCQLQLLNRRHTAKDFLSLCNLLKGENISVDILAGIENQTEEDIIKSVKAAVSGGVSHISMYALKPEEGTPLFSRYLDGLLPSEDEIASLYAAGVKALAKHGFERYEVSNFCKCGKKSMHNMNYWKRGEYIGFGAAASSFLKGVRFTNTSNFDDYIKCVMTNRFPVIVSEEITDKEARFEKIMLALRTTEGLDLEEFNKDFSCDFKNEYKRSIQKNYKYLEITEKSISILPEYLFVQNNIIIDFLN